MLHVRQWPHLNHQSFLHLSSSPSAKASELSNVLQNIETSVKIDALSFMEAGRIIFSRPPIRSPMAHVRSFSSCAVDERAASGVNFSPAMTIGRHFPSPILFQEHTSGPSSRADTAPSHESRNSNDYCEDLQYQLLSLPGSWYLFPSAIPECKPSLTSSVAAGAHVNGGLSFGHEFNDNCSLILSGPLEALTLARTAVLASKEAAALADHVDSLEDSLIPNREIGNEASRKSMGDAYENTSGVITIKSRRLVQRRLMKRKIPMNPKVEDQELPISTYKHLNSKISSGELHPDDPYRLFLSRSDRNPLLSPKEERELVNKVHEMMRLEEVKRRLEMQFGREPTLAEWAEALGVNCQNLQACIASGNSSREKMISSNLRLVVHLAKIYQGKGLSIQDLLQEGSMGLMKSLEKFKPQANCRFASYAYWWIRQSMRKAIYLKSRTIRLPENVYALLARIKDARNSYKVVGHLPSNEDVAKDVGISVAKLETLLRAAQVPVSIQQRAWGSEGDITFQEIIADPEVEIPETIVAKQLMRHRVHSILMTLRPKERQIIKLRYGIHDGEKKTLSEIGAVFGITKERVRQVESAALHKLKKCLESQGPHSYRDLLV